MDQKNIEVSYWFILKRFGLDKTGLIGMFLLVSCSSLSVVSIFLPGSPLDLTYFAHKETEAIIEHLNVTKEIDLSEVASRNWLDPGFWLPFSSVLVLLTGIILARLLLLTY